METGPSLSEEKLDLSNTKIRNEEEIIKVLCVKHVTVWM